MGFFTSDLHVKSPTENQSVALVVTWMNPVNTTLFKNTSQRAYKGFPLINTKIG